jgi:hypothetical protein
MENTQNFQDIKCRNFVIILVSCLICITNTSHSLHAWLINTHHHIFLFLGRQPPVGHDLLIHEVSRSHTQRRATAGGNPLDEWSARRRDLYLTTHNTQHSQQTNIHAPCRIRTHNLSRRAASGTGHHHITIRICLLRVFTPTKRKINTNCIFLPCHEIRLKISDFFMNV